METEFKLRSARLIEIATVDAVVRAAGVTVRSQDSVRLVDTYLDDARGSLARAGVGFCLRDDARGHHLTCKTRVLHNDGRCVGEEHAAAWPTAQLPHTARELPPTLRDRIEPFVLDQPLMPRLRLETQRELRVLQIDGLDLCELAIDRVAASAAGRSASFFELELAVLDSLADNERLAATLRQRLSLQAATDDQHDQPTHAAALLGLEPASLAKAPMLATTPIGEALATILDRLLATFCHGEVSLRCDREPNGLHSMRVAVRRWRGLVRAFQSLWPAGTSAWLLDQLGALGRQLGTVRDLDVMLTNLASTITKLPTVLQPAAAPVLAWVSAQREQAATELQSWLRTDARLAAMNELVERTAALEQTVQAVTAPIAVALPPRLGRAVNTVRKLASAIEPELPTKEAHQLRLATKRLRYLVEDFARCSEWSAWSGPELGKSLAAITQLQQTLGTVCDHENAARRLHEWIAKAAAASPDPMLTAAALGGLIAQHGALAQKARRQARRSLARTNRKKVWRRFTPDDDATAAV